MTPVITVCGFGRCGSSLVMQMLHAGGIPCLGQAPAYEDRRGKQPIAPALAEALGGAAIKVLDPQRIGLPAQARVIWLDRDPREQAKSLAKFMAMVLGAPPLSRWQRRQLEADLAGDRRDAMRAVGDRPLLKLDFETILRQPAATAGRLAQFVAPAAFDAAAAAAVVIDRPAGCAPDMGIELRLLDAAKTFEEQHAT